MSSTRLVLGGRALGTAAARETQTHAAWGDEAVRTDGCPKQFLHEQDNRHHWQPFCLQLGQPSITGCAWRGRTDPAAATPGVQEGTLEPWTHESALLTFVSLILTAMTCLRWRMISMSSSHSSISLASCMAVFTWPGTAKAHAIRTDTLLPEPGSPAALPAEAGTDAIYIPHAGPWLGWLPGAEPGGR